MNNEDTIKSAIERKLNIHISEIILDGNSNAIPERIIFYVPIDTPFLSSNHVRLYDTDVVTGSIGYQTTPADIQAIAC